MNWNRPQSINPVISSHPTEGTLSQNSLSENGAKISGFCNPEAHLIISIITLRKKPFLIRLQGRRKVPSLSFPQPGSPESVWSPPIFLCSLLFSDLCTHGKVLDSVVYGWTELLAKDHGTWRVKRKLGLFLVCAFWRFNIGRSWEGRALGPRLAQTLLSLFVISRVDSK